MGLFGGKNKGPENLSILQNQAEVQRQPETPVERKKTNREVGAEAFQKTDVLLGKAGDKVKGFWGGMKKVLGRVGDAGKAFVDWDERTTKAAGEFAVGAVIKGAEAAPGVALKGLEYTGKVLRAPVEGASYLADKGAEKLGQGIEWADAKVDDLKGYGNKQYEKVVGFGVDRCQRFAANCKHDVEQTKQKYGEFKQWGKDCVQEYHAARAQKLNERVLQHFNALTPDRKQQIMDAMGLSDSLEEAAV